MVRRLISLNVPEAYIEDLEKLKPLYKSRNSAITIAVKRLLQDEARMGHLTDPSILRYIGIR